MVSCNISAVADVERPKRGISELKKAGFENFFLDLNWYGKELKEKEEYLDDKYLEDKYAKLFRECEAAQCSVTLMRAPYCFPDMEYGSLRNLLTKLHKRSLALCARGHSSYLIIRPFSEGIAKEQQWEVNREIYLQLAEEAKRNHIMILLENRCEDMGGHLVRGLCTEPVKAVEWVDELNRLAKAECFGFCMDVGACNLCGQDMQYFTRVLGHRLRAVVLRDCDGHQEASMLPFTSVSKGQAQTDWLGLLRGLRDIGYNGQLILDMTDTISAFSQLLRPSLFSFAKSVCDYFVWQLSMEEVLKKYASIVLFGAGNMCRNYMKCFGEKYPPLFTCDNNKNLWGTKFCGLEVKPPEALLSLPEESGIFICNIYYKEIAGQLREMGLRKIEFFNDECMSSFYFDRIERESL